MQNGRAFRSLRQVLALLPLLLLACSRSADKPTCPPNGVGAIEGYLTAAGAPISANVRATPPDAACCGLDTDLSTKSDSAGWFHLPVPSGDYVLRMEGDIPLYQASGGAVWNNWEAVPIHVAGEPVRADFTCGRLTVDLDLPGFPDGTRLGCALWQRRRLSRISEPSLRGNVRDGKIEFAFAAVPPGTYWIEVSTSYEGILLPGTLSFANADSVAVGAAPAAAYARSLDTRASISGQVTGAWQAMRTSSPWVEAVDDDDDTFSAVGVDSSGSYRIDMLLARPTRLSVRYDSFRRWIGGTDRASATRFDLHPGDAVQDASISDCGIDLTIEGGDFNQGPSGDLTLVEETGPSPQYEDYLSGGRRLIAGLPPGTYRLGLSLRASGTSAWLPQWYDQRYSLADADPIVLSQPGQVATVTMHLNPNGQIHGKLLQANGLPAGGMHIVYAAAPDQGLQEGPTTGYVAGDYAILGMPDGEYLIGVSQGGLVYWYPGTTQADGATPVSIVNHGEVDGIDWRLP